MVVSSPAAETIFERFEIEFDAGPEPVREREVTVPRPRSKNKRKKSTALLSFIHIGRRIQFKFT
jgi:hypothetical protein